MLKKALTAFILPFLFLLSSSDAGSANPVAQIQKSPDNPNEATGILQKMITETGTATMKLDFNRLNGMSVALQKQEQMRFDIAANSFFSILVFNDLLRGPEQGSMPLIPQDSSPAGLNNLPAALGASFKQLQSKNSLQANNSISPSGTQKRASSFSILKDTNTITTPGRNCLPSAAESSRCRAILPTLLGGLQTSGLWWEKSLSARPCRRWKSRSLLMAN